MEETKQEMEKGYKCKYCGEVFGTPLLLAQHVRSRHKRAKAREKKVVEKKRVSGQINKAIEAIGILKGLQVSPHLSDEERKILEDVSQRIEDLLAYTQRSI
jgi:RNA polymerase-interacting CarD/CdnL/TRCF family regulator